jgi:very-short-patch-repair endonuclease
MPTQEAQSMRSRKEDTLVRKQLRLEQCAWANRRVMTASELRLWSALSARKLGVQFRREVPLLGRYIVDFCAPSVRLVVEVDGECHADRRAADARRDAALQRAGYRALRIEAGLVMRDLAAAVALVRATL